MSRTLPNGWKLISSDYLHKAPWLTVRKDQLQLPGGHIIPDYYVLEYPNWVNTIAITKEGKFILIEQYRHGLSKTSLELCAGVIDPGDEEPVDAAQRELLEETGYGNGHWQQWLKLSPNPATSNNWVYTFLVTGVEKLKEQDLEPSEEISVHELTLDELKQKMQDGSIIQAMHLCPLWKYLAVQKDGRY